MNTQNTLFTRKQAAEFLGVKEKTLAHWLCVGRYDLPVIKIGSLVRYRLSDLEQFITNRVRFEGKTKALKNKESTEEIFSPS